MSAIAAAMLLSLTLVACGGTSASPGAQGSQAPAGTTPAPASPTPSTAGAGGTLAASPGAAGLSPSTSPNAASSPTTLTHLSVGLGYIPNIQFAQFYLAQQAGYYRAAGLDVTFENKIDPDLVTLVGQGSMDIGIADGTSVIPAVSQGIPIRYVTTIYARFPNIVFSKKSAGITTAADLKGKRIGTPGRYGSSWIMLQALLQSAHLTTSDVTVVTFPDFSQAAAVARGSVDAATGFVNNEPIQLEQQGIPVDMITVDNVMPLPGPGLITGEKTLQTKRAALQAFVAATLHAMRDILADPTKGYDATLKYVPDLASQQTTQMKVLEATASTWQDAYTQAHGLGAIDPQAWARSLAFMQGLPEHLVPNPVQVSQLIDSSLLAP